MSSRQEDWSPDPEVVDALDSDEFVSIFPSRSRSVGHRAEPSETLDETAPLLGGNADAPPRRRKKPFYRARPLWLVPFAITAALVRGMTLAPRVEIFTKAACDQIHHTNALVAPQPAYNADTPLLFFDPMGMNDSNHTRDTPRSCKSDPAVTAGAARIQVTYAVTMGLLSALTTGWWGQFGDRYGRTKLLAFSTFGWLLTDVSFILAATPGSPLAAHARKLVLIAPVFEGFFGGWSTLQSTTSAYISDCTSSGSRASVFSRFSGVEFLGFAAGPIIGAWLISHPFPVFADPITPGGQSVTTVFWVAALGSLLNFVMAALILPESISKNKRRVQIAEAPLNEVVAEPLRAKGAVASFVDYYLSPLRTFLPVKIPVPGSTVRRKDWSLTLLMAAMFAYMLSAGLYQIKYLYGSHTYSWTPVQLSYYISFMGGGRAVFLLVVFPFVISTFKPKSASQTTVNGVKIKPKPTKEHLSKEMKFDLTLARASLCIDILANTAIMIVPAPSYTMHIADGGGGDAQFRSSQTLFVMASWIAAWGAGLIPSIRSLALTIMQTRALLEAGEGVEPAAVDIGKLFGSISMLQSIGQMILGPTLFGLIYSSTVATYPKAVFGTAIGILAVGLCATLLVRSPLTKLNTNRHQHNGGKKGKAVQRRRVSGSEHEEEEDRGRSRASKDLRRSSASSIGYRSVEAAAGPSSQGESN
ncbi:hypothetical protein HMN09_00313200 [Mycena chlorophos]|uniref:MFS general substrate transporter n=1 Tax=Mycena chlorophos TaxID=658473 RepID=A0A8H6TLV3_MYCCL|nr:hypothetical protein HMN09_00313200 [Mycena chlorophos]